MVSFLNKAWLQSLKRLAGCSLGVSCGMALTSTMAMASGPTLYTQGEQPTLSSNRMDVDGEAGRLAGAVSKHDRQVKTGSLSSSVSNSAKHRTLDRGPLLLSPTENTVVDTAFGAVSVDAGSVLLIIATNNELAVYNLYDSRKNAVAINYGSGTVSILPECVAVLARPSINSFSEANPAPFVAYRRVSSRCVSAELKLYRAEFDFSSMVRGMPALKQLIEDKTGPTKKTMERMIKTAAIMTQLSQSAESYGYYVTDQVLSLSEAASK